jgi:nicotinate phosphoribosyltransferase
MVYKLVAVAERPGLDAPLMPVAKRSPGKATRGGMKLAGRRRDHTGRAVGELVADAQRRLALSDPMIRGLQVPFVRHGEALPAPSLDEVRAHHVAAKAELGPGDLDLSPGPAALRATPVTAAG